MTKTAQRILLPLIALLLIVAIVVASLQPQAIQWQEGQAAGSFAVDRSAVLLPGTCIQASWSVTGVTGVKLNGSAVDASASEPFCVEPNQSPIWATGAIGGFDRFHPLQVGVLIFRFDFWLLLLAAALCLVGAGAQIDRFRLNLLPMMQALARQRNRLFEPGVRLWSWLRLIGSLIQIFFLLRFLSFVRNGYSSAWLYAAATLLVLWFLNTRLAERLIGLVLRLILFPIALIIMSELLRVILQQWGPSDANPLLAEIYLWRAFLFLFLFLAWGAVYFNHRLRGVLFHQPSQSELTAQQRRFERVRFIGVAALCLSLIGFWAYIHLINVAPTYSQNFSWDTEGPHFIDSLSLFYGAQYHHMEHPDATMTMLSSAVLAVTYPYVNAHGDSFVLYSLQHPALFVAAARGLSTLLCCLCFIALSYWVVPVLRSWRDVLLALALPVSMYALHPLSFETITLWAHHTVGSAISVLVLLCLLQVMRSQPRLRHMLAIALASGLMVAGSYFYGPLAVGVVVTITVYIGMKNHFKPAPTLFAALAAGMTCLGGFISGVAVLAHDFNVMVSIALSWLSHTGSYGGGDSAFISLDNARRNFGQLLANLPLMFAVLVVGGLILILWALRERARGRFRSQRGLWALGVGLAAQCALGLVLVSKMYDLYYALCITAGVTVVLALFVTLTDSSRVLRWLTVPACLLLFIGFGLTFRSGVIEYDQSANEARTARLAANLMLDHYAAENHKDVTQLKIVVGYASYQDCYFLRYGNDTGQSVFNSLIDSLCPNERLYSDDYNWEVYLRPYPPAYLAKDTPIPVDLFDQQDNMELARNPNYAGS